MSLKTPERPKRYRISLPICSRTWLESDMHPLLGSPSSWASARETSGSSLTGFSPGLPPGLRGDPRTVSFREQHTLGLEEMISKSEKPPNHTTALASAYTNALPACKLRARGNY